MKAWMKGAIVGAVWGIVGIPIFYLFIYLWGWEQPSSKIAEEILSILFNLPSILLKPLFEIINLPHSRILSLFIHILSWALVGSGIGYIYQRIYLSKIERAQRR